jgi:hypothetical protein
MARGQSVLHGQVDPQQRILPGLITPQRELLPALFRGEARGRGWDKTQPLCQEDSRRLFGNSPDLASNFRLGGLL